MISLTHITEAELRQYYLLEGKISGRDKEYNMLNGVQQEYVASRIYDFIIWNDHCNKSKFELYIKENLPKMEIKYDTIKKEQEQEQIKKKQENDMKKKIIRDLLRREPNKNVEKVLFAIPELWFIAIIKYWLTVQSMFKDVFASANVSGLTWVETVVAYNCVSVVLLI